MRLSSLKHLKHSIPICRPRNHTSIYFTTGLMLEPSNGFRSLNTQLIRPGEHLGQAYLRIEQHENPLWIAIGPSNDLWWIRTDVSRLSGVG